MFHRCFRADVCGSIMDQMNPALRFQSFIHSFKISRLHGFAIYADCVPIASPEKANHCEVQWGNLRSLPIGEFPRMQEKWTLAGIAALAILAVALVLHAASDRRWLINADSGFWRLVALWSLLSAVWPARNSFSKIVIQRQLIDNTY